jgi:small subunit ribosomal protein S6e
MKQGVFSQGRVRLLLSAGTSCYRARRKGERKRKSVRGCIVGPDIRALSVSIVKKGEKDIPGLTDDSKPRRRAPKTASGIRKLYNIPKDENATVLIKKHVVRRTFKSKKNADAPQRQKAPKIQRLVTDARLRRKKLIKKNRVDAWKKTQAAISEYHTLCHEYFENKRKQKKEHDKQKADKAAAKTEPQQTPVAATTKVTATKNVKAATKPVETQKNTKAQTTGKPATKGICIVIQSLLLLMPTTTPSLEPMSRLFTLRLSRKSSKKNEIDQSLFKII